MKFNPVTSAIAVGLSALIAFGFYSFNDNALKSILAIGSFLFLGLTLVFTLGARFDFYVRNINARVISGFFFSAAFASHLLFSFLTFSIAAYVVVHGIMLLVYLLLLYLTARPDRA